MVMERGLLVSKHVKINVLIVKELKKTAQINPKGHLSTPTGIIQWRYTCF